MDKSIRICYAFLVTDDSDCITPTSLRGFFGNSLKEDSEYHNHGGDGSTFLYRYPLVQYKKISNRLLIIGLKKKAYELPIELSKIEYIKTGQDKKIKINNIEFKTRLIQINQSDVRYSFLSPWLAFNSKNFKQFFSRKDISRIRFLENILIGNILSMFKGLDVHIDFKINVTIFDIYPVVINLNNNQFIAFRASFKSNVVIPEYLGIGKSVSKGFGTVSLSR